MLTLSEGNADGQVGVLHGDLRVYDVLPSFNVDASGRIVLRDAVNGRIQIFSSGALVSTIRPADPVEALLFPAEMLSLPGDRLVTRAADRMSIFDYTNAELATKSPIAGSLIDKNPDGRFLLRAPADQGFVVYDSALLPIETSVAKPVTFGRDTTTPAGNGRRAWRIEYSDACVAFLDSGAGVTGYARRGDRVFVTGTNSIWVLSVAGNTIQSATLPADQLGPEPPSPPPGIDVEPPLLVGYLEPQIGDDGNVYSMVRRPGVIDIVRWDLAPVANHAPVLQPIANRELQPGRAVVFRVQASDQDGDALKFSVQNLPPGAEFDLSTGLFVWTPSASQLGTFTVTFQVDDTACGRDTKQAVLTVTVGH